MKRTIPTLSAALLATVAFIPPAAAHESEAGRPTELFQPSAEHVAGAPPASGDRPPLIDGLGEYGMAIATAEPLAQAYFDQGLGLLWGFNHAEAVRAFRAAQQIDPTCAMCFWGEAHALGPNLNDGMHDEAVQPAFAAAARAAELATTRKERALTAALQARYAADGGDRAALDQAFAEAMADVVANWPEDANLLALHSDALMNLQPWDYWDAGGSPKGRTTEILATLEAAMEIAPRHPAALHLYIHATEASGNPGIAEAAADRLRGAAPAAGHLVHMPAHVYNRIGRFADSIEVNRAAIAADEAFLAQAGDAASPAVRYGYYPHNVHFLLVSAQMAGLEETAIEAAEKLAHITSDELSAQLAWVQAIRTAPYSVHAQFSDPATVLGLDDPGDTLPFVKGFWHYARGTAFAAQGDVKQATAERQAIDALIAGADMSDLEAQYLPARDVLGIARHVVAGRIAQMQGAWDEAIGHLEAAIAMEDTIPYMEPPYWSYPVRQTLGGVLLQAGRNEEAAEAFRAALEQTPNNGWALWGLWQAEQAGGPAEEAEAAFGKAWLGDADALAVDRL